MHDRNISHAVDADGIVHGFPYHDGRLEGVHCADGNACVELRASSGEQITLNLDGVEHFICNDFVDVNLVGYIFLWTVAETPEHVLVSFMKGRDLDVTSEAVREEFRNEHGNRYFLSIESIVGAEVIAICGSFKAFYKTP
jgi:hypothetical protein